MSQEMTPSRIRAIREGLGMTLKEAADQVGVSVDNWSRWERDPSKVSAKRPSGPSIKLLLQLETRVRFKPKAKP